MNSFTPGIIIALLIVFLLGILVGYALVQKRLRKQQEELKISQRRLSEIEQSHELRLREATEQLRHDYETQLSATIEHYQDQLSQKTVEMEQMYETRFRVLQQGGTSTTAQPLVGNNSDAELMSASATGLQSGLDADIASTSRTGSQRELMHLKRQYELRLNEAAQKLQKSYEKQLAENTKAAKAEMMADLEQQVANRYQELEQEFADRQAEFERRLTEQRSEAAAVQSTLASEVNIPTPSEIMGTGDDTTVTLAAAEPPAEIESASDRYTQAELDQQVEAATQQANAEFEQRLTEQLEAQQVQFERRLRELEASYEQRLENRAEPDLASSSAVSSTDNLFGDGEYEDLVSDLNLDADTDAVPTSESNLLGEDADDMQLETSAMSPSDDLGTGIDTADDVSTVEDIGFGEEQDDSLAAALTNTSVEDDEATEATTSELENSWLGEDKAVSDTMSSPEPTFLEVDDSETEAEDDLFSDAETSAAIPELDSPAETEVLAAETEDDWFSDDVLTDSSVDTETVASEAESDLGENASTEALETPSSDAAPETAAVTSSDIDDLFGEDDPFSETPSSDSSEAPPLADVDDLFGEDDLFAETPPPSSSDTDVLSEDEDDLFGENGLFAETPLPQTDNEDALIEGEDELFGDDGLFAETPPQSPEAETASNSEEDLFDDDLFADTPTNESSEDDDDDDDFGPLDLSDISQLT